MDSYGLGGYAGVPKDRSEGHIRGAVRGCEVSSPDMDRFTDHVHGPVDTSPTDASG